MQEAEDEISANRNLVQHNIRELLDSNLPAQISQLEESTVSLERVAAYCEANYIQSQNKATSLAETKRYALQSLASVAYLVGELSRSLMHALELEQMNLAQKTSEIQNITQLVTIQKEKAARREIGKLTTAKNINKQNKIAYPATEERTTRYQRTAIDFSILDAVGHGRKAPTNNNEYGSIGNASGGGYAAPIAGGIYGERLQINRTNSTTSGESGTGSGSGGSAGMQQQQIGPIYDHYARTGNHGTLTRGSIRSAIGNNMHDQYRVPQPIPSAIQLQNHYQSMQQPLMGIDQQQRYASTMGLNGNSNGGQINMINHNNHYECEQYGTLRAPQQQVVNYTSANGQGRHTGNRSVDQMNNSADYSDDGLPLPPPLLMVGQGPPQQGQPRQNIQEDGFPLPPPPHPQILSGTNNQQQNQSNVNAADWIPQQYIEKAICLYDYESRNQDELRLYQGAIVYILRKNEDGWFEGVMDGITGLFPGNYVQRISN